MDSANNKQGPSCVSGLPLQKAILKVSKHSCVSWLIIGKLGAMFVFLLKLVVQYTKYNFVSSMIIGKLGAILGRPVRWNLAQVTHFQHPIIWKWDKSYTFVSLKPTCERYWSSWNHDWCWKTTLRLHPGSPTFKKLRKVTRNDLEINNKWKVCDSLAVRWTVPKDIGNSQEGFLWHLNIPPVPFGEVRSVNIITSFKRPALHKLA